MAKGCPAGVGGDEGIRTPDPLRANLIHTGSRGAFQCQKVSFRLVPGLDPLLHMLANSA